MIHSTPTFKNPDRLSVFTDFSPIVRIARIRMIFLTAAPFASWRRVHDSNAHVVSHVWVQARGDTNSATTLHNP